MKPTVIVFVLCLILAAASLTLAQPDSNVSLNWSEPISIQSLELVTYDQGNGICLCQGLDGNRAAIALVLRQRISVK